MSEYEQLARDLGCVNVLDIKNHPAEVVYVMHSAADAIDALLKEIDLLHRENLWLTGDNHTETVIHCSECRLWTGEKCRRFSCPPWAYCYTRADDFCSGGDKK